ncbi:hypothetical protein XENTR_v10009865 [Xenopus tropicalis]|uniref:C-type lectin domain family 4 member G n=1 Tax=Xenopus tropicalis TaxID=8364 RepID=A0A803J6K1_XENTR|nr:C-type lectin domain family 4 member G [Xenopus tropicalis]KAE8619577.1 hypothetical protein XENTR_v10009865 [Xenopus tropicalis]KAE8619578.1 hypothetical protein XENTR_v10009865 [Xenopus tropicalis]KAE8619579.1 hypothetical protein XENTR_v10009865 [Xenopus tropicalis]|eukprot:XP_017948017.1 PREDICTED: C-type lectin domain family 4 member G-like [Xenopus tropicalis]
MQSRMENVYGNRMDNYMKDNSFKCDDDDDDDYENMNTMKPPSLPSRGKKGVKANIRKEDFAMKSTGRPETCSAGAQRNTPAVLETNTSDVPRFQTPRIGLDFSSAAVNEAFRDLPDTSAETNENKDKGPHRRTVLFLGAMLILMLLLCITGTSLLYIYLSQFQDASTKGQDSLKADIREINKTLGSQVQEASKEERNLKEDLSKINQTLYSMEMPSKKQVDNLKAQITDFKQTIEKEEKGLLTQILKLKNAIQKQGICKLCPPDWKLVGFNCYFFSKEPKSWADSRQQCQKLGSDLLIFTDQAEVDALYQYMQNKRFWIGLQRNKDQKWNWVDGKALTFNRWGTGEPNNAGSGEHCGETLSRYWNDLKCGDIIDFICEGPPDC